MKVQNTERTVGKPEGSVVISSNPKREREFLDKAGNVIDPKTKQILKRAEENK